jgi:hypothetical protein
MIVTRKNNMGVIPRFNGHTYDLFSGGEKITVNYLEFVTIPLNIEIEFENDNISGVIMPFGNLIPLDTEVGPTVKLFNLGLTRDINPGDCIARFAIQHEIKIKNNM